MVKSNNGLNQYYKTGNYKGFYKIRERVFKLTAKTNVTFSNGEKEFFESGNFKEEALLKIFRRIDNFLSDQKSSKSDKINMQYS